MDFKEDKFFSNEVYISWLGSVYINSKKEDFKRAIKSIEWQDCKYMQEIIIVKDGVISMELENFLKNYSFKFSHKIISLKNNRGLGIAMKIGSKSCFGKYIARFDTDDINLPNRLSTQIPILENDQKIGLVSSAVFEKSIKNKIFYKIPYKKSLKEIIYKLNPINHPTVTMNKAILFKVGNYENVKYFEDYYLWLKFVKHGYRINLINDALVLMNIEDKYRKRWGIKYFFYESNFLLKVLKNKLIKKVYIIYFIPRLLSRIMIIPIFQNNIRKTRRVLSNYKIPEI